jgi:hypothetical protein
MAKEQLKIEQLFLKTRLVPKVQFLGSESKLPQCQ